MKKKIRNLEWFIKRVGKRIYRDSQWCPCATCKDVLENGVTIFDKDHAEYLYDCQNDYGVQNIHLNYRDKM